MIFIHVAKRKPSTALFITHGNPLKKYQFFKKTLGFTLIELIVVMTIIALLISIAVPRYFHSVEHAKEATLKQTLSVVRVAIDKFYGDNDRYPSSIAELVNRKYIRKLPLDPITDSTETWVIESPSMNTTGEVYDIKSGAPGKSIDGSFYADW